MRRRQDSMCRHSDQLHSSQIKTSDHGVLQRVDENGGVSKLYKHLIHLLRKASVRNGFNFATGSDIHVLARAF